MKERHIKIIVLLMTLAVLGLIGVQLYWISNAFKVEEQKFKSAVNEALNSTVKKLEKRETANVVINKFITDKDKKDTLIIKKEVNMQQMILTKENVEELKVALKELGLD